MADDLADLTRKLDRHLDQCDERAENTRKMLDVLSAWQGRFDSSFRGAVRIVATALLTLIASVVGAAALNYFQQEHAVVMAIRT